MPLTRPCAPLCPRRPPSQARAELERKESERLAQDRAKAERARRRVEEEFTAQGRMRPQSPGVREDYRSTTTYRYRARNMSPGRGGVGGMRGTWSDTGRAPPPPPRVLLHTQLSISWGGGLGGGLNTPSPPPPRTPRPL